MSLKTVVVITGAAPLRRRALAAIPDDAVLIAADGGLDHALGAGLAPDVLVGDLDSVTASSLSWASTRAEIVRHPIDKDVTDTELALAHAAGLTPDRVMLVAGGGDRIDHAIAALGALGAPALQAVAHVDGWWGDDRLFVATASRCVTLPHSRGAVFSLLALHGPCSGVTVTGARWPLASFDLDPVAGRGVSNEVLEPPVTVSASAGVLTVIVPGGL
ncbi:MAG: thiamine diphosphokinase [Desertimonas sp.]